MESRFDVQLFNRQLLAFYLADKVQLIPLVQITSALAREMILPETLYFNNTVLTKRELINSWIIPLSESWLAARIPVSGKIEN